MKADFALVRKVLSLPTAPLHEERVLAFIRDFCRQNRLSFSRDRFGNLRVRYRRGKGRGPVVFVAHTDHPGFEAVRGGKKARVRVLGGVPLKFFPGARVVAWKNGRVFRGKILKKEGEGLFGALFRENIPKGSFGYFDLVPVRFRNGKIETKAADNLASVAILLNLLQGLCRGKKPAHAVCLFTRAEEVGLVGAQGALRERMIPRGAPVVVLEASSAKVGKVRIGGGPVLRVGDRISTFSNGVDLWLQGLARRISARDKKFRWQRALLSGGACEATLFAQRRLPAGCLAFPLGNYHNAGRNRYAPETISQSDYRHMLEWLAEAAASGGKPPVENLDFKRFEKAYRHFRWRLLAGQKE